MSGERAPVFGDDLDLSGFQPKALANAQDVRDVAEKAGFISREPVAAPVEPVRREQRRYRTGRNVQLSLKVRQEDLDVFYQLADREGIVLGEAFARAVTAWKDKLPGS